MVACLSLHDIDGSIDREDEKGRRDLPPEWCSRSRWQPGVVEVGPGWIVCCNSVAHAPWRARRRKLAKYQKLVRRLGARRAHASLSEGHLAFQTHPAWQQQLPRSLPRPFHLPNPLPFSHVSIRRATGVPRHTCLVSMRGFCPAQCGEAPQFGGFSYSICPIANFGPPQLQAANTLI